MARTFAVVGAGVTGASVAYHLARAGASVTLLDSSGPAAGATGAGFGWISGISGDWPGAARELRRHVLDDYRRLCAELPAVEVRWSPSLILDEDLEPGDGQRWAYRDEIASLEPSLRAVPSRAVFSPSDGGVDPGQVTSALVNGAVSHGARVAFGASAVRIVDGGVLTSAGLLAASTIVLAAGTGIPALCAPLGVTVPVAASPGLRVRVAAPAGLVRTILAGPDLDVREYRDGELLTASRVDDLSPSSVRLAAEKTVQRLRAMFGAGDELRLLDYRVGMRPMPPSGPIIGYLTPSVYVIVMHSAITLGITAGRLAAEALAA
jgi:glycine/D-amino acid oxidase-like deaminating enzyme